MAIMILFLIIGMMTPITLKVILMLSKKFELILKVRWLKFMTDTLGKNILYIWGIISLHEAPADISAMWMEI
jgi:hypothetical protein